MERKGGWVVVERLDRRKKKNEKSGGTNEMV